MHDVQNDHNSFFCFVGVWFLIESIIEANFHMYFMLACIYYSQWNWRSRTRNVTVAIMVSQNNKMQPYCSSKSKWFFKNLALLFLISITLFQQSLSREALVCERSTASTSLFLGKQADSVAHIYIFNLLNQKFRTGCYEIPMLFLNQYKTLELFF